jgi:hypothetical protein
MEKITKTGGTRQRRNRDKEINLSQQALQYHENRG